MAKKKNKKPNVTPKVYTFYENGKLKKKVCPKCGPGVFLAEHKDRFSCGKCGYTEFKK
ncbi:MAG: ubiquitin-small subunit ribosomal protein S27Ae [Candidatus Woesearchaeota archaeon]|nr:ubiquitin-small subunit ribosomal protein S27Ae [Candidatus Woesearchaeota archaeon]MDN5327686.1 ubiquitin-small subunit ribosomal protein S27Ae [Candidatus Woesearchaeota archaeon]